MILNFILVFFIIIICIVIVLLIYGYSRPSLSVPDAPDRLVVRTRVKRFPAIYHYGFILKSHDGKRDVLHNPLGKGPCIDSLDEFLKTRFIDKYWDVSNVTSNNDAISKFIDLRTRKKFSVISYNCASFVNELTNFKNRFI
jgi:hypothetical protein